MPSVIDSHPHRKEIIDALLSGKPLAKIASIAGISKQAVHNYKVKTLKPALATAAIAQKALALTSDPAEQTGQVIGLTRSIAQAAPIIDRLYRRQALREKWAIKAENKEDYRTLTNLDACEHRDIRLECELTGLLVNQQQPTTVINLVCQQVDVHAAPADGPDTGEVLDISPLPSE